MMKREFESSLRNPVINNDDDDLGNQAGLSRTAEIGHKKCKL
jgi:hypothetical protein